MKKIKRNVVVLGFVSLFTDISSEMLYPIIPIFLTSALGAPISVVGLIEGIAESTASILKAFSGWLSDRLNRRRPFVAIGYSLSALSKPILALAHIWPVVLAARFIDRFGKGLRVPARDAMIADSAEPAYRGLAFGFHRAMDTVGAVLGPCLAIFLMRALEEDYRSIFLISFIPAAISVAIIFIFLRSDSPPVSRTKGSISFRLSEFKTPFKKFLLVSCIFAVGNSSDAFLILRAKGIGFTNAAVILAYVAYNITYSLSSLPFGKLSDKISRKTLIITGYVVFALVYLGFGIVKGRIEAWSLFLIYGFYMAMTEGVGKAFVTDLVDEDKRGTALGLYHSLTGFLAFFASLIAGLLWSLFGAPAAFLYGAAAAVFSCLVFVLLFRV